MADAGDRTGRCRGMTALVTGGAAGIGAAVVALGVATWAAAAFALRDD